MFINIFERLVFLKQLDTGFFTNPRHARQVIATIALKGFEVEKLVDVNAIFRLKMWHVKFFNVRQAIL